MTTAVGGWVGFLLSVGQPGVELSRVSVWLSVNYTFFLECYHVLSVGTYIHTRLFPAGSHGKRVKLTLGLFPSSSTTGADLSISPLFFLAASLRHDSTAKYCCFPLASSIFRDFSSLLACCLYVSCIHACMPLVCMRVYVSVLLYVSCF